MCITAALDETLHSSSSETFAVVAKYAVNLVYCTGFTDLKKWPSISFYQKLSKFLDVIGLTAQQNISQTHLQT